MAAAADPRPSAPRAVEIGAQPAQLHQWTGAVWDHRSVMWMLARKDFQVRYKRATLGIIWAVAVPLLQAAVLAVIFSRFVKVPAHVPFGPFVFAGTVCWSYFSGVIGSSVSAIVDGAGLTDKVWFPRALLAVVPSIANLVSFGISLVALIVVAPLLGAPISPWLLVLGPATLLLVAFSVSLSLVLSALDVYFRDVKYLVGAALIVWMYATPVVYPQAVLGSAGRWLDFNPMTGIVNLFHLAILGQFEDWHRSVLISVIATVVLFVVGVEAQRRHDRLFVDLL
ncbi:MAG: ABC transporter permease [Acidimicrobiia bacterium]|nr:ABC transporter permease [Acidimicrobiia bacterium]